MLLYKEQSGRLTITMRTSKNVYFFQKLAGKKLDESFLVKDLSKDLDLLEARKLYM